MEFRILMYLTEARRSPVREYLDRLKAQDADFHAVVMAAINNMRDREYHRRPFSEQVRDGLFAVRASGERESRIFFYFRKRRQVILLHGFTKTTQELPTKEIKTALRRMRDHQRRYPDA